MKKTFTNFVLLAVLFISMISTVQGQLYNTQPFDSPEPTLAAMQTPAAWYPDRYQPAIFDRFLFGGTENVLRIGINQSDGAQLRSGGLSGAFYNTQGRKYDLANDVTVLYGSLYIPADWATKHRRSDLWATAFNGSAVTDYPIIGFANTTGTNPVLRYWDQNTANGWVNITSTITYDTWYDFKMVLYDGYITYYINGVQVAYVQSINGATSSKYFGNIIVQGYNFNDNTLGSAYDGSSDATYEIYWDNIGTAGGPITTIGTGVTTNCDEVSFPVTVKHFNDIGNISLKLNYDPMVLEYVDVDLNPAIDGGSFTSGLSGLFSLSYMGMPGIALNDNDVLFTLNFKLKPAVSGGNTALTWLTSPAEANEYSTPEAIPLINSPFGIYFINGLFNIPVRPVKNTNTGLEYCSIQAAINDPATNNNPGDHDVITVAAGTYAENIIVNKSVDLLGPKASIDGCDNSRGTDEAIIVPSIAAVSSGEIFHVAASYVTIKGFTIDGDNPLLPANGYGFGGADMHAAEGITVYETGINNLTVSNNILKNLSYFGVTLYDYPAGVPSSGHVISNNKFQDFGTYAVSSGIDFWGGGVLLYNNQYTAVTNNCMTNVRLGIQTGNFSQANPGASTSQVISGNTIQARRTGIFHNLHYGPASTYTLSGNSIVALDNPNETKWDGICLASLSVPSISSNNTINGNGSTRTNPTRGYEIWNVKSTSPASISGDASHPVTGVDIGVFANNFEGYSSDGGDGAHATVSGLYITPKATGTGVRLLDSPSSTTHGKVNLSVTGCTITGALEGVKFEETLAGTVGGAVTGNTISASAIGINVTGMVTSATNSLSITANNITLASQLAGSNPTVGILLTKITGTQAALISNNSITGPFYGYMIYNLNTAPVTTITGGNITGVMQGIAALNINPATGSSFAPSTFNLDGQVISGFIGTSVNPNINFHAGVYVFTGGSGTADVITANVNNVSVTGTGNIQQDCAGLSFADFSTGSGTRQNITVTACTLTGNLNRGINVRGANALVDIGTSTLTGNGFNPYGLGGNDGFGIIARENANVNIHNCFITNPAVTTKPVTAILTDGATILAINNFLDNNGNSTMGKLAVSGGVPMTATCNWLGSTVPATNAALIAGPVSYNPWLCSGTDVSVSVGFQGVLCNSGAPVVGPNGAGSVQCLSAAIAPIPPVVLDVDGITILTPVFVSMVDSPDQIVCEGNRTYTYSFTNCSGFTTNWSYVYTIDHITAPVLPANGGSSVECLASVTTPTPPSGIVDICGVSVTAVPALVPYVDVPASLTCEGTRTYSWTYTDCSGLVSTWNYVYTIEHTSLPKEIGGPAFTASTVECEASATAPTVLPNVQDICGNLLTTGTPIKQLSIINKFDAPVVLGATPAPGVWYTDRYAPAGFVSLVSFDGGNRLKHSILSNDGASSRPSGYSSAFYNTQGRSYDLGSATDAIEVKLYIPADWATSNKRMAGLWGVPVNNVNAVSGYPIVEFTSDGNNPRFRAYDNGTYVNMGLPAGFSFPGWVTLKIRLLSTGEFLLSAGSLNYVTTGLASGLSVRLKSAILQGHNYDPTQGSIDNGPGVTYDIYWDDFTYNDTYAPVTCEGAISYTYNYADCAGLPYAWTYTYTIDHTTAPVVPANGFSTVECLTAATAPATPTVVDVCNLPVTPVLVSTIDSPISIECGGTRTYNYTYTDCSGLVSSWNYVYTILHTIAPAEFGGPVSTSGGTVECVASATAPTALPVVKDVCGNTLLPLGPPTIGGGYAGCEGTYTYTYNYVDCAGLTYAWTYTYTIDHVTPPVVPANGAKIVSCPADAVAPTLLPGIADQQQLSVNTGLATPYWNNFTSIGQSFTCGTSGKLTQLDVRVGTLTGPLSFTLQIYQGNGIAGALLYSGSQTLSATGWQSLNITQNVAPYLTAGQQYTFWLTSFTYNQLGLFFMYPNAYSGGVSMDGCTSGCATTYAWDQWPDYDLTFKTYMTVVPVVNDVCGTVIPTPTPVESGTYNGCEGTKVYTYTYTDCSNLSTDWVYTYTIERNDFTMPGNGNSTVACIALATQPTPPTVNDNCGNAIIPTGPTIGGTYSTCEGTRTYTWKYTDCEGNWHNWVYTYTIEREDFTMPANAGQTVACASLAVTPTLPVVQDNCLNVLTPAGPAMSGTYVDCEGTIIYTYGYTDCEGNTHDWVYTYTIEREDFTMPANAGQTVACASLAVAPTLPVVKDNCLNVLTPAGPAMSGTYVDCEGTIIFTYTYTDCEGTAHDWVFTYNIERLPFTDPTDAGATIGSGTLAVTPTIPTVIDNCLNVLIPAGPTIGGTFNGCTGTITYTYIFTDCEGNNNDWVFTYTVVTNTLSGTLKYNNSAKTPMNNVTLTLTPGGATSLTDGSGNYSFPGLCAGTYTIAVTNNNKSVGGINSTDAGAVNAWGTSGGSIEYVKFLSGDVTNDYYAGSADAQRIQKYFVNDLAFTRASWSYWKKGDMILSNSNPYPLPVNFPTIITVNVAGNIPNLDLLAQCTGDFNGSFTPSGAKAANSSLTLTYGGSTLVGPSQEFELPVRATSAMSVGAVSLILDIPSDLVEVQDVTVNGSTEPVTWAINGNELRIGWNSVNPVSIPAEGSLVTLKLKTTEAFTSGQSIVLGLVGDPLNELADESFNSIEYAVLVVDVVDNLAVGINGQTDANPLTLSNYPNPFSNLTTVNYSIPVDGKVVLEVYTLLGQHLVTLVDETQTVGKYSLKYNGENLQQGIYSVRLRLINDKVNLERSIKFVINK